MSYQVYPDVSSNNGPVDIVAVIRAGAPVVGIKATEGTRYVNPYHALQVADAHEHYTGVVHYHYCRPAGSVAAEAAWFWAAVEEHWRPWDRLMIDAEVPGVTSDYMREFCVALHHYAPGSPLIGYTYQALYPALAGSVDGGHWVIADFSGPATVRGSDELWAHQYTQTGHWLGITGACDLNQLNARHALEAVTARRARQLEHHR